MSMGGQARARGAVDDARMLDKLDRLDVWGDDRGGHGEKNSGSYRVDNEYHLSGASLPS